MMWFLIKEYCAVNVKLMAGGQPRERYKGMLQEVL